MEDLKGLILSGGKGTRLRPLTHTSAKQLVPVANKPVLFYGLEAMAAAGIKDVGIIVAPETGGEIRTAVGDGSRVRAAHRVHRAGRARAAWRTRCSRPSRSSAQSPFVMYLGDNLLRDGIVDLVASFRSESPDALILLTPVPDPESYGVAELNGDGAGGPPGREAHRAEDEPGARGRLHVHPRDLRGGALDRAVLARRARDHGRHPDARGARPARGPAHRARLVEGHRPGAGHARGQPPDPRRPRGARGRRGDRVARGGPRGDRGGREARAGHRARPGHHRARLHASPTPTSARTRRSATTSRSRRPSSSTRSCSPARR